MGERRGGETLVAGSLSILIDGEEHCYLCFDVLLRRHSIKKGALPGALARLRGQL